MLFEEKSEPPPAVPAGTPSILRIGISMLHMVPGRRGGVERELREILPRMGAMAQGVEFVLFVNEEVERNWPLPAGPFHIRRCPVRGNNVIGRALYEQRHLPRLLADEAVAVLFCPAAVMPLRARTASVVLINDLQAWHYPQNFPLQKRLYLKTMVPLSARRAAHIITISECARRDILDRLHVAPEKVSVAHLGAPPPVDADPQAMAAIRHEYGIPERYFMCLATSHPHKNLPRLVEAFKLLCDRRPGEDFGLALVGMSRADHDLVARRISELGLQGRVVQPGRVSDEALGLLYSGALAFVFPSLFEGFGLPVLEAMACGCPVACSNAASLPEVGGEAAVYFNPLHVAEMAGAMAQAAWGAGRERLVAAGRERAAQFSWDTTARRVLDVLIETGTATQRSAQHV